MNKQMYTIHDKETVKTFASYIILFVSTICSPQKNREGVLEDFVVLPSLLDRPGVYPSKEIR